MNFNALLLRLRINPDNFVNQNNEPIIEGGLLYDVEQSKDNRVCLYCNSSSCIFSFLSCNWLTIRISMMNLTQFNHQQLVCYFPF